MVKSVILISVVTLLVSCGVDTSSSSRSSVNENTTVQEPTSGYIPNPLVDLNPIGDGNSTVSGNGTGSGDGTNTGGGTTPPPTDVDQSDSDFDINGAIEDKFSCLLGDTNNGFTNNVLKDGSNDYLGTIDEEDGLGINSRYSYNVDATKTEVALYYYDLQIGRSFDIKSIVSDDYTVSIDTAWADNEKSILYVRTPRDGNDLYGCYRYDVKKLDVDGSVAITKVYRLKEN